MITAIHRLSELLNEDYPSRLITADNSASPPRVKNAGYSFSHSHRIALPLTGCHKMEIAKEGNKETIRPLRGSATFMPRGVWNMVDWYTPVEVATLIFDGGNTFINHIDCPGDGLARNHLTRIALPPLQKNSAFLMEMLLKSTEERNDRESLKLIWLLVKTLITEKALSQTEGKADYTYQTICSWLKENWTTQPSRDEVASLFKITPNYLSQLFRNRGGVSYSTYLRNHRLIHARRLLIDENMTLAEIGYLCGYPDPAYFCRIFKKHTGYTPTEYRLANRQ